MTWGPEKGWEGQEVVLPWQSGLSRRAVCPLILSPESLWHLFLALVPSVANMCCRAPPVDASGGWRRAGAVSYVTPRHDLQLRVQQVSYLCSCVALSCHLLLPQPRGWGQCGDAVGVATSYKAEAKGQHIGFPGQPSAGPVGL